MANNEFGTSFFKKISLANFDGSSWSDVIFQDSDKIVMHPAAHVLHYSSACFEGIKAFRINKRDIGVFRLDAHINRMLNSANDLYLPSPEPKQLSYMILELLKRHRDQIPSFPGSAYIRPTLIGTDTSIGRAASPSQTAMLFILVSPVGDYLSPDHKVRVVLNTQDYRCAPHFGSVKSGSNYASALGLVMRAKKEHNAEQIIFAPNGDVQETAATNCLLINDSELITKGLSSEFLPGVTRDSLLSIAKHLGYKISERNISADELIDWTKKGEVALSGTAAVLAPVGEIVYKNRTYIVNNKESKNTMRLRKALNNIQCGESEDIFNWLTIV